jgi:site-specific recombinase XerC
MQAAVARFLDDLTAGRGFSPKTAEAYRRDLDSWMAFLKERHAGRLPKVDDLRSGHVTVYLASLSKRGLSARTLARQLAAIRSFARWLGRHGHDAGWAAGLKGPRLPRPVPAFLTEPETERLFRLDFGDGEAALRDRAILELFYATGIRLAELVGLDRDEALDLERGQLRVRGKGNRERIVPFGRAAADAVTAYRAATEEVVVADRDGRPLFLGRGGVRIAPRTVQRLIARHLSRVADRAGLSPHLLRHTVATHLLARMGRGSAAGAASGRRSAPDIRAVQELLGHASLSSTQVYTHVTVDRLRRALEGAHPRGEE